MPLGIYGFFGSSNHQLELGLGYTLYLIPTTKNDPFSFDLVKDLNQISAIVPLRLGLDIKILKVVYILELAMLHFCNLPEKE